MSGVGGQSSVRLVTDKGFKFIGRFTRFVKNDAGGIELGYLAIDPTVMEGMGNGVIRVGSLRMDAVTRAGLTAGDVVVLSDEATAVWPIEVHGLPRRCRVVRQRVARDARGGGDPREA